MRRPTETQIDRYVKPIENALIATLQTAVRALPLVQLVDVAPESRRKGAMSDQCFAGERSDGDQWIDGHKLCRAEDCDCGCHEQWEGYAPSVASDYQGIRNHPVGKTWHDHDDTSDKALAKRTSREWLERFAKIETELRWLAQNAVDLVGAPVETCPCGEMIKEDHKTAKSGGRTWHKNCLNKHDYCRRQGKPSPFQTASLTP